MYEDVEEVRPGLYIKKGRQVRPILKDIRKPFSLGNIDWKNFLIGDWWVYAIIISLVFTSWAYVHDMEECSAVLEKPCTYCYNQGCGGCLKPLPVDEFVTIDNIGGWDARDDWQEFDPEYKERYNFSA